MLKLEKLKRRLSMPDLGVFKLRFALNPRFCAALRSFSLPRHLIMATAARTGLAAQAAIVAATLPPKLLDDILDVAVRAAKAAGHEIRANAGRVDATAKFTAKDLVTEVDSRCQALIEGAIKRAFPTHEMLGEEDVPPGSVASAAAIAAKAASEWLWIVDPLDGTTSFVHGFHGSCVSIGVAHRGTLMVGVVFNPHGNELFTAVAGRGAFCNGERIHVASHTESLSGALLGVGFHSVPIVAETMVKGVAAMLRASRGVRCVGSAALHLAFTAAGRLTGFWELDLSSWDVAAGALLVAEAGGRVTDTRGGEFSLLTRDLWASCGEPGVHEEAMRVLESADAAKLPSSAAPGAAGAAAATTSASGP